MDYSTIRGLIDHYGYLAVLIGTILEGDTVLMLAGFAAHRGYLSLPLVLGAAALGGFLGDQFWYWLGRTRWPGLAARFPSLGQAAGKVHRLLDRYDLWIIVGIRFMYGLRIAGPTVIGTSRVSPLRFAVFNLLGALLWALLIGGLGYAFGEAIEMMLQDAKHYEKGAVIAIVALGLAVWLYRWIRRRKVRARAG